MKIVFQFVTSRTLADMIVRVLTRCPYSNVDIVLPEGLLGARPNGGVQIRPFNYQPFSRVARFSVEAPEAALEFAKAQIGKPYDWWAVIGGLFFQRDWQNPDFWYCPELGFSMLACVRIYLLNIQNFPLDGISCRDLLLSPLLKREAYP